MIAIRSQNKNIAIMLHICIVITNLWTIWKVTFNACTDEYEFKKRAWVDRYQALSGCAVTFDCFYAEYKSHLKPGKAKRGISILSLILSGQLLLGENVTLFSDEGFGGVSVWKSASLRKIRVSFSDITDW